MTGAAVPADQRTDKRDQILGRALEVFVANGYVGTTTDRLAAAAAVSKQTLYKEFGDKEGVFAALIEFACDRVDDPFAPLVERMREVTSADEGVGLLSAQFTRSIMTPQIQQLRRLVIAEAVRFPHLGLRYWERGFLRVIDSVGRCLDVLDDRGLLDVADPRLAAHHFAGLLLWIPSNQVMFAAVTEPIDPAELDERITAGTETFLRAHRPRVVADQPLHHVELWTDDLAQVEASFDWLMAQLGWEPRHDPGWPRGRTWHHASGVYLVLEESPAVTGPHDRMRAGLNHLALNVASRAELDRLRAECADHGWSELFADRYPHAGGPEHTALFIENAQGFEVEIVRQRRVR